MYIIILGLVLGLLVLELWSLNTSLKAKRKNSANKIFNTVAPLTPTETLKCAVGYELKSISTDNGI